MTRSTNKKLGAYHPVSDEVDEAPNDAQMIVSTHRRRDEKPDSSG